MNGMATNDKRDLETKWPRAKFGHVIWMFAGSERGGKAMAIAFTLIVTAKLNGIDPLAWLTDVLKGAKLMPDYSEAMRIVRLGDYPNKLEHFKNIDVVVCNTPGIAERVKKLGWTLGIEVISNFTPSENVKPISRIEMDTPEDAFVVTSMGRFVARKGFDTLIASLANSPDTWLWLLGDGEDEQKLKDQAQQLGVLARIRFAGWQVDTRPYVAASDVFAMASSHEPLGNVVLEAWAQDIPVISTRCEGPNWFMTDGENGLMVDIGDADGFTKSYEMLRNSDKLAEKIVAGGRKKLESTFSQKAVCDAYMELFNRKK
jgi:glycosyltransferase involved in cell wall biosynthesis